MGTVIIYNTYILSICHNVKLKPQYIGTKQNSSTYIIGISLLKLQKESFPREEYQILSMEKFEDHPMSPVPFYALPRHSQHKSIKLMLCWDCAISFVF
jgi:hypothetical protein